MLTFLKRNRLLTFYLFEINVNILFYLVVKRVYKLLLIRLQKNQRVWAAFSLLDAFDLFVQDFSACLCIFNFLIIQNIWTQVWKIFEIPCSMWILLNVQVGLPIAFLIILKIIHHIIWLLWIIFCFIYLC